MDAEISAEASSRKERSEAILVAEGVPINKSLPVIEGEPDALRRTKEEVAYRVLALLLVAMKGGDMDQPEVDQVTTDYGLEPHFTPKERAFILQDPPLRQDCVNFGWRFEAAWPLLWALGYLETLEKPNDLCDPRRAVQLMEERTASQFVADAVLRPMSEILDQADLSYRYHWAVVDARVNDSEPPNGVHPGVTYERLYAFNWLVGYLDQEWDDITTDT